MSLKMFSYISRWQNGWRTKNGKFATLNGPGRAGEEAERSVGRAIKAKPGWDFIEGPVGAKILPVNCDTTTA